MDGGSADHLAPGLMPGGNNDDCAGANPPLCRTAYPALRGAPPTPLGVQTVTSNDIRICIASRQQIERLTAMSLSDLDLVQQAMAPTEPGAQQNNSNSTVAPKSTTANGNADTEGRNATKAEDADDSLAGIDLSQLNDKDREALQPILDALKASSGKEGEEGGDLDIEGILSQLDAAGDVADTLEGRLDKLLENLGEMEKAQQEQSHQPAQASAAEKK